MFSTKPIWTWAGAHTRLLLSISRKQAGSFQGNKKTPELPLFQKMVLSYIPQQQHTSQESSSSWDHTIKKWRQEGTSGCPGIAMRHWHRACPLRASTPSSAMRNITATFSSYNDDQLLSHFPIWGTYLCSKTFQKHFHVVKTQSCFAISISTPAKSLHYIPISIYLF